MKESMWGYALLAFGVMIISFMLLVQNLTSTSEEDFYLSREVLEASMYDAIDYGTYAKSGKLVMSEAKFVEVFLRRFAENVTNNKDYTINFYDIHEYPPKATVTITTSTGTEKILSDDVNINAVTYLNAILETTYNYSDLKRIYNPSGESTRAFLSDNFHVSLGNYADIPNGKKISLTFMYLDDNNPCGYRIARDGSVGFYMTKEETADFYNTEIDYCYAKYNDKYYFIDKSDFIDTDD